MQLPGGDKHKGEVWVDALGWFQGEVTIEDDVRPLLHLSGPSRACADSLDVRRAGQRSAAPSAASPSGRRRTLAARRRLASSE